MKYGGKISGMSGLVKGKPYGIDYYTGDLRENSVIPLARATSDTKMLVLPIA